MYRSLAEIVEAEKMSGKSFWQVVLEDDIKEQGITFNEGFAQMKDMYLAMKHADKMYDDKLRSASGMVGTDGGRLEQARLAGGSICGDFIMKVLEKAVKMGESNACMKRIVAAPTAGSCGVIPAVLISMEEEYGYSEDEITKGLIAADAAPAARGALRRRRHRLGHRLQGEHRGRVRRLSGRNRFCLSDGCRSCGMS